MSAAQPGTPPGKTTVPPLRPVARGFSHMPTAPRVLHCCMLRGTAPCREPFRGSQSLPEGFDDDEGRRLFSGMLARQRARWSVPLSFTISFARSRTYSSVPIAASTTVTHPSSATRTSTLSRSDISSVVGTWPFGGRATALEVLTTTPMSSNSHRRKKALIVLDVIPIEPREASSICAKASTPCLSNSSLKRFSPGRKARQNIAGPMGFLC